MTLPHSDPTPYTEALPQSGEPIPQSAVYVLDPCPSSTDCLKLNGIPGTQKYHKTCCPLCAGIGKVPAPHSPNPLWVDTLHYMRKPFSTREKRRTKYEPGATVMEATARVWAKRRHRALTNLKRGTMESRPDIKARIWERDGGRCVICDLDLNEHPKLATLGHRLDQVCGGSDSDCNLDLQCRQCNSQIKPLHTSLEAYFSWLAEHRGETDDGVPAKEKCKGWFARLLRRRAA